jgi:hypothetical protein
VANKKFVFFIIKILVVVFVIGQAPISKAEEIPTVANSDGWIQLLHYRVRWFGSYKSKVTGSHFFLAKDGRTNPEAELAADLAAARVPKGDFICHFPARYRFMKKHFELAEPASSCPAFERWIAPFRADGVSMVYSSPYFSNPSSAMGHSLLRFSSTGRNRLADVALGYAAEMPPDVSGASYIYNGLTGGFRGSIFVDPYYGKVHEYNIIDNRDLWEYKLNFTPDEIRYLLEHIWEFDENAVQYYYFLDENCSLLALDLLNAVRPDTLLDQGLYLYVLPIQAIRILDREGWVSSVSYFPSQRTMLWADIQSLSPRQRQEFDQGTLAPEPKLLNTMIDYLEFKKLENHYRLSNEDQARYRDTLIARAKLVASQEPDNAVVEVPARADRGNDPHHVGVDGGVSTGGGFTDLTFYPGVHEATDPENGYVPLSEVSILATKLRYYTARQSLVPESIRLIEVANRAPYTSYDPLRSFHLSVELNSRESEGCYSCIRGSLNASYGVGTFLFTKKLYGYVMGATTVENGFGWSPAARLLLGPEAGVLFSLGDRLKLISYFRDQWTAVPSGLPLSRVTANLDAGYLVTPWCEISTQARWILTDYGPSTTWTEASLGAKLFF